jgi:hypothetical protein
MGDLAELEASHKKNRPKQVSRLISSIFSCDKNRSR